jgi:hypothetical protein
MATFGSPGGTAAPARQTLRGQQADDTATTPPTRFRAQEDMAFFRKFFFVLVFCLGFGFYI